MVWCLCWCVYMPHVTMYVHGTSFPHVGVVKTSGDSGVTHLLFEDGPTVVSIISFLSSTPGETIHVDG